MDLQKIGTFLKDLRKEKGLTQEQLAETLNVSRRTVSRWETGSNMPDLDLLMEIADLYEVDLREMLNGERKSEDKMNKELEETVLQVAEYTKTLTNSASQKQCRDSSCLESLHWSLTSPWTSWRWRGPSGPASDREPRSASRSAPWSWGSCTPPAPS